MKKRADIIKQYATRKAAEEKYFEPLQKQVDELKKKLKHKED